MAENALLTRKFLFRDAEGRNVDVEAKLYSLGRQEPYFSITSQNGADHESILLAAPDDIKEDIQNLVRLHLCGSDGTPMHAVENASYFLSDSKFKEASRALGGVVTNESLFRLFGECSVICEDPKTVDAHLEKVTAEARVADRMIDREKDSAFGNRWKETKNQISKVAALLMKKEVSDLEVKNFAQGKYDDKIRLKVKVALRPTIFKNAVSRFVAENCRPIYLERANKGKEILARPDYRVEGRPEIEEDPTTFVGFIRRWGLEMQADMPREVNNMMQWRCIIHGKVGRSLHPLADKFMDVTFSLGAAYGDKPPSLEQVLENLQSEFGSVFGVTQDEWLQEYGFAGDMKAVRKGEDAYNLLTTDYLVKFKEITGGEEAYQELMTAVGDNPPLRMSDFEVESASPNP